MNGNKEYKHIDLPNGDYIQIKFDTEGIVYDRFSKDDEHLESYGYDFYDERDLLSLATVLSTEF